MTVTTVKMVVPAGTSSVVGISGTLYLADSNGVITASLGDVNAFLNAGLSFLKTGTAKAVFLSPIVADLISIKAAATPANGAITIAAQPPHARKLQIRVVIGTTTTTAITAGTLTLVGVDQDGNAISEVISLVLNASATLKSTLAYASLTSGTVAAYAASGSGTGNTLGIGLSNDFGVPTIPGSPGLNLVCFKATKNTKVFGTSAVAADDVAATTTVDAVARTIAPTTAPGAAGTVDFQFDYTYGINA